MSGLITVGVDGSEAGREALRFALSEGRLRGAPVRAVHAWSIPPLTMTGIGIVPVYEQARDELRDAAEAALRTELERAGSDAVDVDVERIVVEGQPAGALLEAAADADLLVVGSRGHGSLAGALLGSVSQQCLHHASCPIAVVHGPHYAERRRIVVGVDGSPGSQAALEWAVDEARRRDTGVHLVCAYHEPSGIASGGITAAPALAELRHGLAAAAERVLEQASASVGDSVPVSTKPVHGAAAEALLAASTDADILVVGSRGRGGFASLMLGSVSQRCAARASGVVVVVHSGPAGHASARATAMLK